MLGLADGLSNKSIGALLFVTIDTVKTHLKRIYAKLGVRSRAEAAARGLYTAWHNLESMHSLDYVRESLGSDRPIASVGFDCRVSRPEARATLFPEMVFTFFDRLDPNLLSRTEREDFKAMSTGLLPVDWKPKSRTSPWLNSSTQVVGSPSRPARPASW